MDQVDANLKIGQDSYGDNYEKIHPESENREDYSGAIGWLFMIGIMVFIWVFVMRRMGGGAGGGAGGIFSIGKSKATLFDANSKVNISFKDIAGLEEEKEEIIEIVEFLKHPDKFTKLGAKICKVVLLIGATGIGKTLLANAVACEA